MEPLSCSGSRCWNNNENQTNNLRFSSTKQEMFSQNHEVTLSQQGINNSRTIFPCYSDNEYILENERQIDPQEHPSDSAYNCSQEKNFQEMDEFPNQNEEDTSNAHQPTCRIFEGQERYLKQEWKFKCMEEDQDVLKHGEQSFFMYELEKEESADNQYYNYNDRISSFPQLIDKQDSKEQWQSTTQPLFFSGQLSPLFKRNSIQYPITPPVSPMNFRGFEGSQSQLFFGLLEGEIEQQYASQKSPLNLNNQQEFELISKNSQNDALEGNTSFGAAHISEQYYEQNNYEIISDQSEQKDIQNIGDFMKDNEITDQPSQIVLDDPKTAKLKYSTLNNITITSQDQQPQKGRIRHTIYQGSDELHNSPENYEDIGKLGKKNIVRNLLRAFARFFFAKNSLKDASLLGAQTESEIKTQFRRYFHQKGFNNSVIKQLVQHPTYGKIFKYFLEKQAMDYLLHSNVKAKENHQKFIEYILSCFDDIKLLRNLETYSKLRIC